MTRYIHSQFIYFNICIFFTALQPISTIKDTMFPTAIEYRYIIWYNKSFPQGILSIISYILKLAENHRWTKSCLTKHLLLAKDYEKLCMIIWYVRISIELNDNRNNNLEFLWLNLNWSLQIRECISYIFKISENLFCRILFRIQSTLTLFIADVIIVYWNTEQWTILIDKKCRCCKNKDVFRSKTKKGWKL